ncbi:MAG: hypothetical protein GY730_10915 [bacterium]|nr:hypothetical protein [bacterium]
MKKTLEDKDNAGVKAAVREVFQTSRTAAVLLGMHGYLNKSITDLYYLEGKIKTLKPLYGLDRVIELNDLDPVLNKETGIIDFAAGHSSFTGELNRIGIETIAVDRDFNVLHEEGPVPVSMQIDRSQSRYHPAYWEARISGVINRMYEQSYYIYGQHSAMCAGDYKCSELPYLQNLSLPASFDSKKKVIGFCSNFLFLYGYLSVFDADFHTQCILNMMRFVDILSIYPTNILGGGRAHFIGQVCQNIEKEGYKVFFNSVPFANWADGSSEKMLVTKAD